VPKAWDRFAFSIPLRLQDVLAVSLAIRYVAPGVGEWWDNNAGLNYEAVVRREEGEMGPEPVCPIDEDVASSEDAEREEEDEEEEETEEEERASSEEEGEETEEEVSVSGSGTELEETQTETQTETQMVEEIGSVEDLDSEEQVPMEGKCSPARNVFNDV
jgi:hypothetical protein